MKSKAFTLVELLGVMVLITLLALVIIPNVTTYIKKASIKADESTLSSIKMAAKEYASDYADDINNNGYKILCVYKTSSDNSAIVDLTDAGYLDITKEKRDKFKEQCVKVSKTSGKNFSYEFVDKGDVTADGKGASVKMDAYTYGENLSKPSITSADNYTDVKFYYSNNRNASKWDEFDNVKNSKSLVPGTYYMYAKYNSGGKTIQTSTISFMVYKATLKLELTMNDYAYGGTLAKPVVTSEDADLTNAKITYYYSAYSSFKNSQIWDSNAITNTTLAAGVYYMYAETNANDYYKSARSATVKFTVSRQDAEKITIAQTEYVYDGRVKTAALSNESDALIDYEYYSDEACSKRLTSENSKNGLPIDVGSYSVVAYLSASDKNHLITNEGECVKNAIVINKRVISTEWDKNTDFVYNGSFQRPTARFYTLDDDGNKKTPEEVTGETLNFSISGQINAGKNYTATATLASVTGGKVSNYEVKNNTCNFNISKVYTSVKALNVINNMISATYGESGEFSVKVSSDILAKGTLSLTAGEGIDAYFEDGSTSIYADSATDNEYLIKYTSSSYPKDTRGYSYIKVSFEPDTSYSNNFKESSVSVTVKISDGKAPVVTFDPDGDTDNISSGRTVSVKITDDGSGLKGNKQRLYYAWSKDKEHAPDYFSNMTYSSTKKVSELKVGDYVKMSPTGTSFTTDKAYTGGNNNTMLDISELDLWKVIKINDDGSVDLVSAYVSSTDVTFSGMNGYKNFVGYLNTIARQYENSIYTLDTRHFGYGTQNEYCDDINTCDENADYKSDTDALGSILVGKRKNGEAACYWVASRTSGFKNVFVDSNGKIGEMKLFGDNDVSKSCAIRPVITLKPSAEFVVKSGNSEKYPYVLANSFEGYADLNISDGAVSASFDVPQVASSDLTGVYYLWIKGGITDVSMEESVDTVSKAFSFNNEIPSFKLGASSTSNSITVTVNTSSDDDIFWNYRYLINGETAYSASNNVYTFKNLTSGTEYEITVIVTNSAGQSAKKTIKVSTKTFDAPTFERNSNTLKIIYPKDKNGISLCNNGYECTYKVYQGIDASNTTYKASGDVNFDDDSESSDFKNMKGTRFVVASISDNTNTLSATFEYSSLPILKKFTFTKTNDEENTSNEEKAFHSDKYKRYISEIYFSNSLDVPDNAVVVRTDEDTGDDINYFDVSDSGDGSVKAWLVLNGSSVMVNGTESQAYTLYIGGSGGVYANSNSSSLFANMINVKFINFDNNFDTVYARNMSSMFMGDTSLVSLDLSSFDTSNVTNYSLMFANLSSLTSLDLSHFVMATDFSVGDGINMRGMFMDAISLSDIKFGKMDTSNVITMSSMFKGMESISRLNLCQFDTRNVRDMSSMFEGSTLLTRIFVGPNWSTKLASDTSGGLSAMFDGSGTESMGVTKGSCVNTVGEVNLTCRTFSDNDCFR